MSIEIIELGKFILHGYGLWSDISYGRARDVRVQELERRFRVKSYRELFDDSDASQLPETFNGTVQHLQEKSRYGYYIQIVKLIYNDKVYITFFREAD